MSFLGGKSSGNILIRKKIRTGEETNTAENKGAIQKMNNFMIHLVNGAQFPDSACVI